MNEIRGFNNWGVNVLYYYKIHADISEFPGKHTITQVIMHPEMTVVGLFCQEFYWEVQTVSSSQCDEILELSEVIRTWSLCAV